MYFPVAAGGGTVAGVARREEVVTVDGWHVVQTSAVFWKAVVQWPLPLSLQLD